MELFLDSNIIYKFECVQWNILFKLNSKLNMNQNDYIIIIFGISKHEKNKYAKRTGSYSEYFRMQIPFEIFIQWPYIQYIYFPSLFGFFTDTALVASSEGHVSRVGHLAN